MTKRDGRVKPGHDEEHAICYVQAMSSIQDQSAKMATDLAILKWMTGTTLAGVVALVIKTFLT